MGCLKEADFFFFNLIKRFPVPGFRRELKFYTVKLFQSPADAVSFAPGPGLEINIWRAFWDSSFSEAH